VSVVWQGVPLRDALSRWSAAEHLCIVIDRRVDPHQPLRLAIDDVPLRHALEQLADRLGLGLSFLGPVAFLGPAPAADRLGMLSELRRDEVQRLPRGRQADFQRLSTWEWDDLATPRELVADLCRQADVKVDGLDQVPHDLWPRAELAHLSWTDRLTLVLIGFDLTFRIHPDARRIEIRPIPDPPERRKLPHESAQTRQRPAEGKRAKKAETPSNTAYTLTVRHQSLDEVLRQIGKRLQLQIDVDRDALRQAGVSLDTRVSFDVKNATLDELLSEVLRPAGLSFERQGNAVRILIGK
jgi:hypothetical protein